MVVIVTGMIVGDLRRVIEGDTTMMVAMSLVDRDFHMTIEDHLLLLVHETVVGRLSLHLLGVVEEAVGIEIQETALVGKETLRSTIVELQRTDDLTTGVIDSIENGPVTTGEHTVVVDHQFKNDVAVLPEAARQVEAGAAVSVVGAVQVE